MLRVSRSALRASAAADAAPAAPGRLLIRPGYGHDTCHGMRRAKHPEGGDSEALLRALPSGGLGSGPGGQPGAHTDRSTP